MLWYRNMELYVERHKDEAQQLRAKAPATTSEVYFRHHLHTLTSLPAQNKPANNHPKTTQTSTSTTTTTNTTTTTTMISTITALHKRATMAQASHRYDLRPLSARREKARKGVVLGTSRSLT